ncbi:MAG: YciI family protein [Congregibacter sp.]
MYYAIMGEDHPNSLELRMSVRETHLARMRELVKEGRMLLAGPHPAIESEDPGPAGFTGSLIVAEFDSLEDAREWAEADPYSKAGVFKSLEVKPFKLVLP